LLEKKEKRFDTKSAKYKQMRWDKTNHQENIETIDYGLAISSFSNYIFKT
jgi:hypothetical protein